VDIRPDASPLGKGSSSAVFEVAAAKGHGAQLTHGELDTRCIDIIFHA
jgi:hypothetical protein